MAPDNPASPTLAEVGTGFCSAVSQHGKPVTLYIAGQPVFAIAGPGRDLVCTQDTGHQGSHAACDGEGRTGALSAIRGRSRYIDGPAYTEDIRASADDVPLLLAAVEAVLEHHRPNADPVPHCPGCTMRWPCPTYEAITSALAGKEAGDGLETGS